jgi:predicted dehydrogenase
MRRVLIAGAGGWARNWAGVLARSPRVEIAGWIDVRPDAAEAASAELGLAGIATGTDLAAALDAVRPDFLLNAASPEAHRDVTILALEAGVPVLCEKPMADTMQHARDMVAAAEATGLLLMISQQRSYDARLLAMRKLIVAGTGPLGILNSDFYIAHPQSAFHKLMGSPLLLDMAIHTFDAARLLSGADPVSVWCDDFRVPWSWWDGNESAIAMFEMSGGLRYTYRGSWASLGENTPWEAEWRAIGPKGTSTWDGIRAPVAEIYPDTEGMAGKPKRLKPRIADLSPASLDLPLNDFLDALDTGRTPHGECHDNIKTLAMVFAAIESARTGQRVTVETAV